MRADAAQAADGSLAPRGLAAEALAARPARGRRRRPASARPAAQRSAVALRVSLATFVVASWFSAAAFAAYIVGFYLASLAGGNVALWDDQLPGLSGTGHPAATIGLAAHLAGGAIVLGLGPLQLVAGLRRRWPAAHRWLGRLYAATAAIAGAGGLAFVVAHGTIGGVAMDVGFGIYGGLMLIAAEETVRHARAHRIEVHRRWGIRLFALAIGSWAYRMDYGFWLVATGGLGHTPTFDGPFDVALSFFYVPYLVLAETFIRTQAAPRERGLRFAAAMLVNGATAVVVVATWFFVRDFWGPGMLRGFGATT